MPTFLTEKTAGLPRYVWVGILVAAVGGALILRSRKKKDTTNNQTSPTAASGTDSGDPCDPTSAAYNAQTCAGQQNYMPYGGYTGGVTDSGNVCDPTSVSYDPTLCQSEQTAGITAAQGGINRFPSINVNYGAQTIRGRAGCRNKPKAPKNHHYECKNSKWVLVKDSKVKA